MSTKNNKSTASLALLEMDAITSAIKEESKKTLNVLLAEAVRTALREDCEEDEDKDYDVIDNDDDTNDNTENESEEEVNSEENDTDSSNEEEDDTTMDLDNSQEDTEDSDSENEWDEFSEYQSDSNTYDLTGEKDYEKVVKVFKLLKDEDQVVVKKDGDMIHIEDNETDTEYVIDLGDVEESDDNEDYNYSEELNESDIAGFGDEVEFEFDDEDDFDDEDGLIFNDGSEFDDEVDFDNEDDSYGEDVPEINGLDNMISDLERTLEENKKRKKMSRKNDVLFEIDLGYTDNYQDKDPIKGLSNEEPSKTGKTWDKVPTGTKKPWAGKTKSKGAPFEKTVNEEDEMAAEMPVEESAKSTSSQSFRKATKTNTSKPRRDNAPKVSKKVSTAEKGYEELVAENKKLKEAIVAIRKNLSEAYVTNANLGKITKLFLENTTSQSEKIEIVNRFSNEAKTIEQSKNLYESISRELNKTKNTININESSLTANGSTNLNESKVYKSEDLMKTIDFMNRLMKY